MGASRSREASTVSVATMLGSGSTGKLVALGLLTVLPDETLGIDRRRR